MRAAQAHLPPTDLSFGSIEAAARRLKGHAVETPLLFARDLSARTGGDIFIKAENLQIGGSFKFRGAFNRLSQLNAAERANGVVAWSSGNHAQGVAAAGSRLGIPTTIVMPADAPQVKVENTEKLGGQIIFYDRYKDNREAIGRRLSTERGATVVPPYDDPDIIAGQGTVGLEMAAQLHLHREGASFDALLAPCGGGGLIAGCAIALKRPSSTQPAKVDLNYAPAAELNHALAAQINHGASVKEALVSAPIRIYAVEPQGFDDTARSLVAGRRESNAPGGTSLCDALMAPMPGELTFPINLQLLAGGFVVSDEMVLAAIRYAWRELKLVVEPGGAVALAAVLHGLLECRNQTIGIVLSGGNIDAQLYKRALD